MMALQTLHFLMMLCLCTFINAMDYNQPISAADYATGAGQGFSTNYFKTDDPLGKYHRKNVEDVYALGFKNLRIRCNAELHSPEDEAGFNAFLDNLETVVDDCLTVGVWPIISWIHHNAEIHPNEAYRQQYINWWVGVATRLQNKDYRLGFNLFTELGFVGCEPAKRCVDSIRENTETYTIWTESVVAAIRGLPGNNKHRIILLTSPKKDADGLSKIEKRIYENDNMLAEFHFYASGPSNTKEGPRHWSGCGSQQDKEKVRSAIVPGAEWAANNIPVYFGAWMANDNKDGSLDQDECECFACYFAQQLKEYNIPWSLNVLDKYYDTKNSQWVEGLQTIPRGSTRQLNMVSILEKIKTCMQTSSTKRKFETLTEKIKRVLSRFRPAISYHKVGQQGQSPLV